ncbi:AraC family transcriptional regulator [Actinocatenispora rupis]|uniref:HTH-type transcriptional regulator RipA n=1 Tax=Actinocatenispora rupis TaxID=519421 RepID=A0A8J3NAH6_9ACTN|nr:helix-turn-helix transcriptional regulator [Actinocatenispora rupis]GID12111.1 AraC family transcriptional regulator [Actinocatenispora rupis]
MQNFRQESAAPASVRPLAAGERIDPHRHDEHQILYAGRGVLSVRTDGGLWVAPGTHALWIPAGTVHAHHAHGRLDLHSIGLPATDNPLRLTAPAVLAVGPLLRELILAYTREVDDGAAERRRLRAVLLDRLRRAGADRPVHLPEPADPRLAAVCELLRRDPADRRTLAALGAEVGASERTLTRLCAAELGMTFPQWRARLRLYHALLLLAERQPVTTVAHRCGWSSASAFIDVFRRAFGSTPGAYR